MMRAKKRGSILNVAGISIGITAVVYIDKNNIESQKQEQQPTTFISPTYYLVFIHPLLQYYYILKQNLFKKKQAISTIKS